ncbi:hypothetical protein, variant [Batrachochytrium dendrobatidis JEL423]|uniref:Uncharacterized protein n=1 Tax=Batrachochytrium dendrobatidis (strain JEL423) TaxID=403673 RepID=A0A177WJL3_BATDL|nr:hypothetical protein, variant [Batrachochytrium dendrobatidis JEL423]
MICGGLSNLFGPCLGPQQDISIIQRSAPPPAPIIATIYTPPVQQSKQSSYISTAPDKKMNPIISAYAAASGPGIDYSLCGPPPVTWVGTIGNSIPANAIPGGNEKDGLPLYIARGWIDVSYS